MNKILLILLPLILLPACTNPTTTFTNTQGNEIQISLELAQTPLERAQGLMFRTSLDEDKGMLFIFENPGYHKFWMKNTYLPLDLIFISEDNKIIDILSLDPCTKDSCPTFKPKEPAKYVIEVNKGFISKNNIEIGQKVEINY